MLMYLRKLTTVAVAAIVAMMSLNSCQLEPYELPATELYTRSFIKEFGLIDPNQDWNMAKSANVTIQGGQTPTPVKIYAKVGSKYHLVADLKGVIGCLDVPIDIPESCNDLAIRTNGHIYYTSPGGVVSLSTTRSRTVPDLGLGDGSSLGFFTQTSDYTYKFNNAAALSYASLVPEKQDNVRKVPTNFEFTGTDDITLYPMFMCSSSKHVIGIYFYLPDHFSGGMSSDGESKYDYGVKELSVTVTKFPYAWDATTITLSHYDNEGNIQSASYNNGDYLATILKLPFYDNSTSADVHYRSDSGYSWTDFCGNQYDLSVLCNSSNISTFEMECKPITIHIQKILAHFNGLTGYNLDPNKLTFGFYCDVYSSGTYQHTIYSSSILNRSSDIYKGAGYLTKDGKYKSDAFTSYFSTEVDINGTLQSRTFIGFEDWAYNNPPGDLCDLNDVLFMIADASLTNLEVIDYDVLSETPISWLIAAEDLGSTDDFDFNDVVFALQSLTTDATHVTVDGEGHETSTTTTTKKVTVQALAAGGTLPVWLHYNNNGTDYIIGPDGVILTDDVDVRNKDSYEWHRWFNISNSSKMINTGYGPEVRKPRSLVLTEEIETRGTNETTVANNILTNDFKIETYSVDGDNTIRGFYITVGGYKQDGGSTMVDVDMTCTTAVCAPQTGAAPQMFLIPDIGADSNGWRWPTEREHIMSAYPTFKEWVGNPSNEWYKFPANKQITTRPVDIPGNSTITPTPDSGTDSGTGSGTDSGTGSGTDPTPTTTAPYLSVAGPGWGWKEVCYKISPPTGKSFKIDSVITITTTKAGSHGDIRLFFNSSPNWSNASQTTACTTGTINYTLKDADILEMQNAGITYFYILLWSDDVGEIESLSVTNLADNS